MNTYRYKADREIALEFYKQNGMELHFDPEIFNGVLIVEAPDVETAEKIRSTYTDKRMWDLIED